MYIILNIVYTGQAFKYFLSPVVINIQCTLVHSHSLFHLVHFKFILPLKFLKHCCNRITDIDNKVFSETLGHQI